MEELYGQWISECIEPALGGWIGTTQLFESWQAWAEQRQEPAGSVHALSRYLGQERGWKKRRNKTKTLNGFAGFGWIPLHKRVLSRPCIRPQFPQLRAAYRRIRATALAHRHQFNLTQAQHDAKWIESGHAAEYGQLKHQYRMARINITRPFQEDNVQIITNSQYFKGFVQHHSPESKARQSARSKAYWAAVGTPGVKPVTPQPK